MYRNLILALAFVVASASAYAGTSLRVGSRVLTIGDSAVRVLELMGEPTVRAFSQGVASALPNNQLSAGEQWQYAQDGKTIVISVVGGRVANIETLYR
ncbi:DUF2845 domain-containing protein [Dyella sp.]|uniref:DUF2845 domain-containing protein n=1 Tax=Dyella sp. TaxID=1869338 RepID=UPI002FDB68DB